MALFCPGKVCCLIPVLDGDVLWEVVAETAALEVLLEALSISVVVVIAIVNVVITVSV